MFLQEKNNKGLGNGKFECHCSILSSALAINRVGYIDHRWFIFSFLVFVKSSNMEILNKIVLKLKVKYWTLSKENWQLRYFLFLNITSSILQGYVHLYSLNYCNSNKILISLALDAINPIAHIICIQTHLQCHSIFHDRSTFPYRVDFLRIQVAVSPFSHSRKKEYNCNEKNN